jgi:hypothetical protein
MIHRYIMYHRNPATDEKTLLKKHCFPAIPPKVGKYYFADLRVTFRQNFFLQDWFRNKLGVGIGLGIGLGLEMVFGTGLVLVNPLLCYVLSL